jgi:4-hydroxybenzoate polyprenyltransferase
MKNKTKPKKFNIIKMIMLLNLFNSLGIVCFVYGMYTLNPYSYYAGAIIIALCVCYQFWYLFADMTTNKNDETKAVT